MKRILTLVSILITIAWSAQAADTTVKLSHVHLCCGGCTKGVDKAVSSVSGATAKSDQEAGTVTITAPDQPTAQKAVDALVAAGYFGASSDPAITVKDKTGAEKGKVSSLKISGVHLCCGKCVAAVNDAVTKVKGVKGTTAAKGAESFEVTGDFKAKPVFAALNKAGFAGTVAK
jgi:copper chaperone CopZ